MPLVPIVDSLKTPGPLAWFVKSVERELKALTRTRNCSPSDFLVTYLELDGNDLGPMIITQKKCFAMILKSISMGGSSQIPIALEAATAIT